MATKVKTADEAEVISITRPKMVTVGIRIVGTSPYMQLKFSEKVKNQIMDKQAAGSVSSKGSLKKARDFDADFRAAQHVSDEGWNGIPAPAIRNACIDVCRMVGYKMTHARMSLFVVPDGFDAESGTPLIRIDGDPPERVDMHVRNATGVVDIRARPVWRNWSAVVTLRFDADQFTTEDVVNLLSRAGMQVGIGEGRNFSKKSNGIGFGEFAVDTDYVAVSSE